MRMKKWPGAGFVALLLAAHGPAAIAQQGMDQININGQFVLAARGGRVGGW